MLIVPFFSRDEKFRSDQIYASRVEAAENRVADAERRCESYRERLDNVRRVLECHIDEVKENLVKRIFFHLS